MIDFYKEKEFSTISVKKSVLKHDLFQGDYKIPKYQCCCISNNSSDKKLIIYLGLSNGCIISILLIRNKILYNKPETIILYKSPKKEGHTDSINALLLIKIHDEKKLISAATDGCIKLWTSEPEIREKDMVHFIDTIYHEKSTVIELTFFKKQELIIGIFSDMKIRVLAIEDYIDNNKMNRIRLTLSSIIEFHEKINPNKDKRYLISSISLKESDITELFVGDNKGNIITYHFIDSNYLKYQNSNSSTYSDKLIKNSKQKLEKNTFHFIEKINLHNKFGVIKILHSVYDNVIYTVGYDNHIICYNTKNEQKVFNIVNSNTKPNSKTKEKTHITDMSLNDSGKELIVADDIGNINFIDNLTKIEIKYKPIKDKIISIIPIKIFSKQEHIFILSEDIAIISRIVRKAKVSVKRHHDADIMKIFAIEPVVENNIIKEDSKVISIGYDKKIKMWDFQSMECINEINGPEIPKVPITISSVDYLFDSQLIALGTEIGKVLFWDIINSEYLPINYEDKYSHKSIVTDIVSFTKKTKENNNIECMLSCSIDGLILFWEINKIEIKEIKKKNTINYEKSDEFIMNEIKKKENKFKFKEDLDLNKYLKTNPREELKIYKCSPSAKRCINTLKVIKTEIKFYVMAFQTNSNFMTIFTGTNDHNIYLWDYKKENYITKVYGTNSFITCMIVHDNYLFSGGIDGVIDVWNILSNREDKQVGIEFIKTINDPDMTGNYKPRINDIIILPKVQYLVFCNNNKKISFCEIKSLSIKQTSSTDSDITCICCLEGNGKLLYGTKQKMINELTLNDILNKIGFNNVYDKYPFTQNKENYEKNELDKYINTLTIMKSLTEDKDEYNINIRRKNK